MSARSQAETRMWQLARQYTGQVGYQRGQKIAGLNANPPVIDCSGWVAFLHLEVLALRYVDNIWSERIISESYGGHPAGIRLTPLARWLESWQPIIQSGKAWAVDPFAV